MAETTIQPQMGLTFEQVWAALMETERLLKESGAETDRRMKETDQQMKETDRRMKETERQMKESSAETDRQMKDGLYPVR
jgi:hypothetical protein